MITEKRINTVELDLKDEDGIVECASDVKLANDIGAVQARDLKAALDELHGSGWGDRPHRRLPRSGPRRRGVGGRQHGLGAADTRRPAAGRVRRVHELREAGSAGLQPGHRRGAARAGIDDILWDYVRRPEGDPATMVVPGLTGLSSEVIGQFLEEDALLRPYGVYQGASVFGISATRPRPSPRTSR